MPPELSAGEITRLKAKIFEFIRASGELSSDLVSDFFHVVESELIVYGYVDGAFFAREYETREDFDCARARIEKRLANTDHNRGKDYLRRLLASCGTPIVA